MLYTGKHPPRRKYKLVQEENDEESYIEHLIVQSNSLLEISTLDASFAGLNFFVQY